jgi:hypothetical protein
MNLVRYAGFAGIVAIGATASAPAAHAQAAGPRPIELGIDAALRYRSADDANLTSFDVPIPSVRVGFFLSDQLSLEPFGRIGWQRVSIEDPFPGQDDSDSFTTYDLGVGALFHFSPDRTRSQPYVRPFLGLSGFSGGGGDDDSASQLSFGAGIGLKMPVADRLGWRIEANYTRLGEDEPFEAGNVFGIQFGLSFFTR